ncbi:MAG: iron dependent repressor, metal binding and dimerization domain protein [Lachnospiraceae bacterium]|nr:iron dependent repressor, metal binding and dimerization domain protein [Lachnospiraceae bacterium]
MEENIFRTQKGYDLIDDNKITYSMEDYLEMIYRHLEKTDYIHISYLASLLNVKPSSASKMAANLKQEGLIDYEKYGVITLTEEGKCFSAYLLHRHNIIEKFFSIINPYSNVKETEQIEHYIKKETVISLEKLNAFLETKKEDLEKFMK